jgi:hypothetical protein
MNSMPELPVKIDISAKASLEVKADIPTTSVGRFVDAITDIMRPLSEYRGLKGDLLRLQREDVAFEIAKRAQARIALEKRDPKPIALKTLIPLLEKGSQEAPDDDFMIDRWATLLSSAATEDSVPPRFVNLMGEINRRQALLLLDVACGADGAYSGRATLGLVNEARIQSFLSELLVQSKPTLEDFGMAIVRKLHRNGSHLHRIVVYGLSREENWSWSGREPESQYSADTDLEILASLGLLRTVFIERSIPRYTFVSEFRVHYYEMTALAHHFLHAVCPTYAT